MALAATVASTTLDRPVLSLPVADRSMWAAVARLTSLARPVATASLTCRKLGHRGVAVGGHSNLRVPSPPLRCHRHNPSAAAATDVLGPSSASALSSSRRLWCGLATTLMTQIWPMTCLPANQRLRWLVRGTHPHADVEPLGDDPRGLVILRALRPSRLTCRTLTAKSGPVESVAGNRIVCLMARDLCPTALAIAAHGKGDWARRVTQRACGRRFLW